MSRLNSFHLAPALWREPFALDGEEAHHLGRVLRARSGDTIRLFDGKGRSGLFRIVEIGKKTTLLELLSEGFAPVQSCPLTLAVGWSKGVRRGFLLEKAVELGASAIWFWQGVRSQGDVPEEGKEGWDRQLVAAAKQCGAAWLPEIRTFSRPIDVVRAAGGFGSRVLCWEQEQGSLIHPASLTHDLGSIAVLGPEGGLDEKEAELFRENGFSPVSLGPNILRFETAAVFILSLHLWGTQQK